MLAPVGSIHCTSAEIRREHDGYELYFYVRAALPQTANGPEGTQRKRGLDESNDPLVVFMATIADTATRVMCKGKGETVYG